MREGDAGRKAGAPLPPCLGERFHQRVTLVADPHAMAPAPLRAQDSRERLQLSPPVAVAACAFRASGAAQRSSRNYYGPRARLTMTMRGWCKPQSLVEGFGELSDSDRHRLR
jgi:hypothetical protein